jgi:DNA-binding IclR family transcriptional regulator
MSKLTEKRPTGAQSLERMALLLRLICANNASGSRVVDLAERSGLEQPTVHRIVKSLVGERMVMQDRGTRRYFLGHAMYEFGLVASRRFALRDACQASLNRIAQETGDTVFLMVRSGSDAVCIDRREGAFPIKAFTLSIGDRRPLGVGAGALALLSALPDSEMKAVAKDHAEQLPGYGIPTVQALLALVMRTRQLGYALHDARAEPGIKMIGVALRDASHEPVAAISVSAIASRLNAARREEMVKLLREETGRIEALGVSSRTTL